MRYIGSARLKAYMLSVMSAVGVKLLGIFISLATIPMTMSYLGLERFGVWMTISSFVALLAFADLGIGNGLINLVAAAHGKGDMPELKRHISNATFALAVISFILILIFAVAYAYIDWDAVFGIRKSRATGDVRPAVVVLGLCICLGIPAAMAQRIQMGMQRGYIADIWLMCGTIAGFVLLLIVIKMKASLPWLVAAMLAPPALAASLNLVVMLFRRPELRPSAALVSRKGVGNVIGTGSLFLVLQLTAALAFSADNLIIANSLGPESVALFATAAKLFSIVGMISSLALKPLWPAFGDAKARGDMAWIGITARRAVVTSGIVSLTMVLALGICADSIMAIWTGARISLDLWTIILFGIWTVVQSIGMVFAMLLNGLHVVGFQVVVGIVFSGSSFLLKALMTSQAGILWILQVNIFTYLLLILVPYLWFCRSQRLLAK